MTPLHWDILASCVMVAYFVALWIHARPDRWMAFQFIVSVTGGILFVLAWYSYTKPFGDADKTVPILALIAGYWFNKGVMFCIIWARFGRAAARSMRMLD